MRTVAKWYSPLQPPRDTFHVRNSILPTSGNVRNPWTRATPDPTGPQAFGGPVPGKTAIAPDPAKVFRASKPPSQAVMNLLDLGEPVTEGYVAVDGTATDVTATPATPAPAAPATGPQPAPVHAAIRVNPQPSFLGGHKGSVVPAPVPRVGAAPLVPLSADMRESDRNSRWHWTAAHKSAAELAARFEVTVGAKLIRRGELLDSAAVRARYQWITGERVRTGDKKSFEVGRAVMVDPRDSLKAFKMQDVDEEVDGWNRRALIWVCAPASNGAVFYSNIGKRNRFHHSSFTGDDVIGAGEWIVENGELALISGNSGHYRPPVGALHRSILYLAPALTNRTHVLLYDTTAGKYVYKKALEFKVEGYGSRYKSHPLEA